MRFDPVYLVAPEPEPPTVSRRCFLAVALGAATAGIGIGAFIGSRWTRNPRSSETSGGRPTAPNPNLGWALELSTRSPGAIADSRGPFLAVLWEHSDEAELWSGFNKLALELLENPDFASGFRTELAVELAQTIETVAAPRATRGLLPRLRALR
jgi:hypothetical protein